MEPRLVHARKAKMMFGCINKTDKLDVKGLNTLQRAGTLPTVWIPPGEVRDKRELPRTRMVFARGADQAEEPNALGSGQIWHAGRVRGYQRYLRQKRQADDGMCTWTVALSYTLYEQAVVGAFGSDRAEDPGHRGKDEKAVQGNRAAQAS